MKLQYISDSKGVTTGVYIPITEWNALKSKYRDIEEEEDNIPQWHKDIILKRLKEFQEHPELAMDFDAAMKEIEERF